MILKVRTNNIQTPTARYSLCRWVSNVGDYLLVLSSTAQPEVHSGDGVLDRRDRWGVGRNATRTAHKAGLLDYTNTAILKMRVVGSALRIYT